MSIENEDLSESLAAELTGSTGMDDHGGNAPDDVLDAVADQEQHLAERDIPVSNDVDDTRQGELDREVEQEQTQKRGQKVPLAALHEERTKRQQLELQLQAQAQQLQQLQAQWQAAQQQQLQAQQEAEIPDPEIDPIGFIKAKEIQFNQALERLQNGGQQPQQQQVEDVQAQFQRGVAEVTPVLVESESRAMQQFPDYSEAAAFVQQTVAQNIRQQHPDATPEQVQNVQTAALIQFTRQCQAQGIDPASYVYQRAQAMGYQPASRAPRPQANTSLSDAHGSARAPDERGSVDASQIANMSQKEFDTFWDDMRRSSVTRPAI